MQLFSFKPEIEHFSVELTLEQPLVLKLYLHGTSVVLTQTSSCTIA